MPDYMIVCTTKDGRFQAATLNADDVKNLFLDALKEAVRLCGGYRMIGRADLCDGNGHLIRGIT